MPFNDDACGHATPILNAEVLRAKYLATLLELAPNWGYTFDERKDGSILVEVACYEKPSWSWWLPMRYGSFWIMSVEEFLQVEIQRLGGKLEDLEDDYGEY